MNFAGGTCPAQFLEVDQFEVELETFQVFEDQANENQSLGKTEPISTFKVIK